MMFDYIQPLQRRPRDSSNKPFVCNEPGCGKRFYHGFHLRRHQREKHGAGYVNADDRQKNVAGNKYVWDENMHDLDKDGSKDAAVASLYGINEESVESTQTIHTNTGIMISSENTSDSANLEKENTNSGNLKDDEKCSATSLKIETYDIDDCSSAEVDNMSTMESDTAGM